MAAVYTTADLVKKSVKNISADLSDADIEVFIEEAQGIIDNTMKTSLIATFDATKHAILQSCATNIAAEKAITYDPGTEFLSLDDAKETARILDTAINRTLTILSDPRTPTYLKSL